MINSLNVINRSSTLVATSPDRGLSIRGQIREKNIPIPCRVRLFERVSGRIIDEVLTDDAGHYEFLNLTKTKYFVIAHHPLNTYNAVIADLVVPK